MKTLELVMLINTGWGGAHRQGNKVTNHTEVRSMLKMCWALGSTLMILVKCCFILKK